MNKLVKVEELQEGYEHNFRISNKLKHNKKIIYGNTLFM